MIKIQRSVGSKNKEEAWSRMSTSDFYVLDVRQPLGGGGNRGSTTVPGLLLGVRSRRSAGTSGGWKILAWVVLRKHARSRGSATDKRGSW